MLIVDDDRDICQVISDIFTEEGHDVNIAYNGESVLREIKRHRYKIMILDYKLSGISGLGVLEKVRQIKPSMQVIMISAYGDALTKSMAKELGAYSFLDKPFNIEELVGVVKKALVDKKRK